MARSRSENEAEVTEEAQEPQDSIGAGASRVGAEGTGVATPEQNAKLEHTEGGSTTRDDKHDMGVPMLPGSPDEPVGPEDALGEGPTRGDYRERIGPPNYQPHESRPARGDEDAATVMEPQRPRTEDIGDVAGKKGGVETAADADVRPAPSGEAA